MLQTWSLCSSLTPATSSITPRGGGTATLSGSAAHLLSLTSLHPQGPARNPPPSLPSTSSHLCPCTSCPLCLKGRSSNSHSPLQRSSDVTSRGEVPLQALQGDSEAASSLCPQLLTHNLHFNTNHDRVGPRLPGLDIKPEAVLTPRIHAAGRIVRSAVLERGRGKGGKLGEGRRSDQTVRQSPFPATGQS